jgi:hypothetical protein
MKKLTLVALLTLGAGLVLTQILWLKMARKDRPLLTLKAVLMHS